MKAPALQCPSHAVTADPIAPYTTAVTSSAVSFFDSIRSRSLLQLSSSEEEDDNLPSILDSHSTAQSTECLSSNVKITADVHL